VRQPTFVAIHPVITSFKILTEVSHSSSVSSLLIPTISLPKIKIFETAIANLPRVLRLFSITMSVPWLLLRIFIHQKNWQQKYLAIILSQLHHHQISTTTRVTLRHIKSFACQLTTSSKERMTTVLDWNKVRRLTDRSRTDTRTGNIGALCLR